MLLQILSLVCVAVLWGGTNPFLRRNTREIKKITAKSLPLQFLLEIKYLLTNLKYLVPMTLNQLGSVLYFVTLQNTDLSLSVPLANSLTFIFTAFSGWLLGESFVSAKTLCGMVFIIAGTSLCCYDKYISDNIKL